MYMSFHCTLEYAQSTVDCRRLRFSSDADIVRLTNARIIIIIITYSFLPLSQCFLHGALAVAQCIVIGPVCEWVCVCVCGWVCYHDNSKLCASILTKLGL